MLKNIFCSGSIYCLGVCLLLCTLMTGCSSMLSATGTKSEIVNSSPMKEETPLACNPTAIKPEDKPRYKELAKKVRTSREEVKETPDGYALKFSPEPENIRDIAEFITYERACCPFIEFAIAVEKDNGAIWLKMEGGEEVKRILRSEFAA